MIHWKINTKEIQTLLEAIHLNGEFAVEMKYENWKGLTRKRFIKPIKLWKGHIQWHEEEQWFITAFDLDKYEVRHFAVGNIIEVY